jgi:hypothetical protein
VSTYPPKQALGRDSEAVEPEPVRFDTSYRGPGSVGAYQAAQQKQLQQQHLEQSAPARVPEVGAGKDFNGKMEFPCRNRGKVNCPRWVQERSSYCASCGVGFSCTSKMGVYSLKYRRALEV